jgi:class 3 adenylate cyclase
LEAHSVERKPATIFAADVEGYSRLVGEMRQGCAAASKFSE